MAFSDFAKFFIKDLRPIIIFLIISVIAFFPWISIYTADLNCASMDKKKPTPEDARKVRTCIKLYYYIGCEALMGILIYWFMAFKICHNLPKLILLECLFSFYYVGLSNLSIGGFGLYNKNVEITVAVGCQLLMALAAKKIIADDEKAFTESYMQRKANKKSIKRPTAITVNLQTNGEKLNAELRQALEEHALGRFIVQGEPSVPKYLAEVYSQANDQQQAPELPRKVAVQ